MAATATTLVAILWGCSPNLNGPVDESGHIEIVGLPAPLVTSQTMIAGNLYVEDLGLGWTADGQGVIYTAFRYGDVRTFIERTGITHPGAEQLGPGLACARRLRTSPHGTYLAFVGSEATGCAAPWSLYIGRAPDYQPVPVDRVNPNLPYAFSGDDRLIGYAVPDGRIVARDLAADTAVASINGLGGPLAFSPDASRLLVGVRGSTSMILDVLALAGDSVAQVGTLATGPVYAEDWGTSLLPLWDEAGLRVVYRRSELGKPAAIAVFSGATNTAATLVGAASVLDGWRLARASGDGGAVAAWFEEWIPTGFLSGYQRSHLYLIDPATGQQRLLANHSGDTQGGSVAFSPDGRRLAFYYAPQETPGPQTGPTGAIYVLAYR